MNDKDEVENIEEAIQTSFRDAAKEKVEYKIGADKTFPDLHVVVGDGIGMDAESSLPKNFDRLTFKPETGYGLLYKSPVEIDKREVFHFRGKGYVEGKWEAFDHDMAFMDYFPNQKVIRACYTKLGVNENDTRTVTIPIANIFSSTLKNMEVWGYLDDELKGQLEKIPETSTIELVDRMGHARAFRKARADYEGVAKSVVCCKCGAEQDIAPAQVLKRAEKAGVNHVDWAKDFLCQKCHPTKGRGRQASSKWALLPKSLKCSHEGCTFEQKQHPSMTEKMAKAKGIGFNEFVATWKCKAHRAAKPHHFSKEGRALRGIPAAKAKAVKVNSPNEAKTKGHRGRVADPKWAGKAKSLVCHFAGCKKVQPQHPSLTLKAAEKAGKTFEEFVGSWMCREHRKQVS